MSNVHLRKLITSTIPFSADKIFDRYEFDITKRFASFTFHQLKYYTEYEL
jgi:hypothetical protein